MAMALWVKLTVATTGQAERTRSEPSLRTQVSVFMSCYRPWWTRQPFSFFCWFWAEVRAS